MQSIFRVYPAIDIIDGQCVRLLQGNFSAVTKYGDPVEVAKEFLHQKMSWIHVVDLDAARTGVQTNRSVVNKIAALCRQLNTKLQVGGGIRSIDVAVDMLSSGVDRIVIGTAAISNPSFIEELSRQFPGRVAIGLDYRRSLHDYDSNISEELYVAIHGWESTSKVLVETVLEMFESSDIFGYIATDISRDGNLVGCDIPGLFTIASSTKKSVIASGGISSIEDIRDLQRQSNATKNLVGVIVGKALHDRKLKFEELSEYL